MRATIIAIATIVGFILGIAYWLAFGPLIPEPWAWLQLPIGIALMFASWRSLARRR